MFVIVVGSGRLATGLALSLCKRKDDVVIVDKGIDASKLGAAFDGIAMDGDPMDMDSLRVAGASRCDLFLAVTGDDNVNAACVQAARVIFDIPRVLARIADPARESFYRDLGIPTVCPTSTGINEVLDLLVSGRMESQELALDPSFVCVRPKTEWVGKNLDSIRVSGGATVVGLVRAGRLVRLSREESVRESDAIVMAMLPTKGMRRLWSA